MEKPAQKPVYLDHAATTPVRPEVHARVSEVLTKGWGNPSSMHTRGRDAKAVLDEAREQLAAVLHVNFREIAFTSGGTEADNLAVRGVLERWHDRGRHLVISAIEHDAVIETCRALEWAGNAEVTIVGCDDKGRIDPAQVAAAVRSDTILVSVMLVNNEVGTIQPVAEIAAEVKGRNRNTLIHTDAVQALGKVPVHPTELGADLVSLSGHKVYGPKGAGALYIRDGVFLSAQMTGGGQERGRRSGTENTPAIAGLGLAAFLAEKEREEFCQRVEPLADSLRNLLEQQIPGLIWTGAGSQIPPFVTAIVPSVSSQLLLTALDERGVYASGGSACSSGAAQPSHVLTAMGFSATQARSALRCALGKDTTQEDIASAASAIVEAWGRLTGQIAQGTHHQAIPASRA